MVSCAICKFEASSDEKLKKHMLSKHDEREFSCDKCDSTVKGRLKMEAHKNKHKKSGAKNVGKVFLITVPQVTKQNVWRKLTNVRSVRRFTR